MSEEVTTDHWTREGNYEVLQDDIEKAATDKRLYRAIRLQNGLIIVLVHDPGAHKAGAALNVAVGHMSDPDEMPGLAHFCEHLLFMGTEQFPRENDYHEFIATHGGLTNAWTAPTDTNFHFKVGAKLLEPALARFAAFFHCPLFEPTCTKRELNAVDSENKKNNHEDGWRLFQLGKGLSLEGHPWHKFGTGSRESLLEYPRKLVRNPQSSKHGDITANGTSLDDSEDGPDGGASGRVLRDKLIEWWKSEYSAPRMTAAIISPATLDELTRLAVGYFSPVPDRHLPPVPLVLPSPLGPNQMGTALFAKTIKDIHTIDITCCIPSQDLDYESRPATFVAHLLGHEGGGCLHPYLKEKGWVTELNTTAQALGQGFDIIRVVMHVTPQGLAHWREVVTAYFQYVLMLKDQQLPLYLFQELQALNSIRFAHKDPSPPDVYVRTISSNLRRPFPVRRILTAPLLLWEWEEHKVRKTLELVDVRRCRVIIAAKDLNELVSEPSWSTERWYGTEYHIRKLEPSLIAACLEPNPALGFTIPRPNQFIPNSLHVDRRDVPADQVSLFPDIIRETAKLVVWFKKDDQYWVPKGAVAIQIKSSVVGASPTSTVMSQLLVNLVTDSLTEYSYEAELAGLRYSLTSSLEGLQLSVAGYDNKIPVLLHKLMESLKTFEINPSRFAVMLHHLQLKIQNLQLESPFLITDHWLKYLLKSREWTREELLAAIPDITISKLETHFEAIKSRAFFEVLIHGHFSRKKADEIVNDIEGTLKAGELPTVETPVERAHILPEGTNLTWCVEAKSDNERNSALAYFCYVGQVTNDKLRATFSLFAHMARHWCFDQLRTKEQLGYVVSAATWQVASAVGWRIRLQSERDPEHLESRVDNFLRNMEERLEAMDEEEFNKYKSSLIVLKQERHRSLSEELTNFWTAIQSGYCDFVRDLVDAEVLQRVILRDVRDCYMTYINPQSQTRRKLSIWCHARGPSNLRVTPRSLDAFHYDFRDRLEGTGLIHLQSEFNQEAVGGMVLPDATRYLRTVLAKTPSLKQVDVDCLVFGFIRRARRYAENSQYENAVNDSLFNPPAAITDAARFKASLPVSNLPCRVIMPTKPVVPARI